MEEVGFGSEVVLGGYVGGLVGGRVGEGPVVAEEAVVLPSIVLVEVISEEEVAASAVVEVLLPSLELVVSLVSVAPLVSVSVVPLVSVFVAPLVSVSLVPEPEEDESEVDVAIAEAPLVADCLRVNYYILIL